jgi:hypothetical protein
VQLTPSRIPEPDLAQVVVLDLPLVPSHPVVLPGTEQAGPLDIVEEWGLASFPASDPPANW